LEYIKEYIERFLSASVVIANVFIMITGYDHMEATITARLQHVKNVENQVSTIVQD
jgi:hypothetical protein